VDDLVGTNTDMTGLKADSGSPDRWLPPIVASLALVVLIAIIYLPSLRGGFLWDDDDHLTNNTAVNSAEGLRQIWSSLAVSRYYPLTLTTFWIGRHLWGLRPLPFRVANVAIHALNAVLLFALLRRLRIPGAWMAAAVWALHPVNVESVAWITELKNTQSFLFFLLCVHSYLRYDETRRTGSYALALLTCAAAFTSKPSTVTLPAILLLAVWWRRRRWQWRDVWLTLPFFAMSAVMSLLTIAEQDRHIAGVGAHEWQRGFVARILGADRALWLYAGKLIAPVNLMFVYPRWEIRTDSVLAWLLLAVVALIGGVLAWRRSMALFGLGYFVLALLPVLGLFDIYYFRFSFVADHFDYIGSAGFLALVVAAATRWLKSPSQQAIVATVVILVLSSLSWQRAHAFQSNEQLWTDTLRKNPSAFLAHNNLADIRSREGEIADATAHWREALRISPTCWEAWMGLGKMYRDTGRYAEAIDCFQHALQLRPGFPDARYGLGMVYTRLGRWPEAREQFERALEVQPHEARLYFWLGDIAVQQGRTNDAIQQYLGAIQEDPALADAYLSLGHLRLQRGETERAMRCFDTVIRLRPGDADAQAALAALRIDTKGR
jgi:tetratricopeptide (TPR) repeat protein